MGIPTGEKAGCENMLVTGAVIWMAARCPGGHLCAQTSHWDSSSLWYNWRGKVQSDCNLQPLGKQQEEDLSSIELFSNGTAFREVFLEEMMGFLLALASSRQDLLALTV